MTTTVNHPRFGQGTVIAQDANNVTVDFNSNVKMLVIAFCNLTNEDGTAFYTKPIKAAKKVYKPLRKATEKELENTRINFIKVLISDMLENNPYKFKSTFDVENESEIVKSIISQAIRIQRISDKQLYVLAKFAEDNDITIR